MLTYRCLCARKATVVTCVTFIIIGMYFYHGLDIEYRLFRVKERKESNMQLTKKEVYDVDRTVTQLPPLTESPALKENTTVSIHFTNQQKNVSVIQSFSMNGKPEATKYVTLFQSNEEEEFPLTDKTEPRIPHIIHQMYKDEMIPDKYIHLVKSFINLNPTWQYRFWTDKSGRQLLSKYHPYLLNVYDKFGDNVKRSDLLRYAVLYEFGGFYADFDMESFRPLNNTTLKYACIFPVEPFEHSALLYNKHFLINNAFMGCRPKHPFLKMLLSELRKANTKNEPVGTTGPGYVTEMFIRYNNIGNESLDMNKTDWSSNSPYFYKGVLQETDNNAVYVPNSQYFMDKVDPIHLYSTGKFTKSCRNPKDVSYIQQRGCFELSSREKLRANKKYTYTVHHWYHLWCNKKEVIDRMSKVNISSIVPNYIQYHGE